MTSSDLSRRTMVVGAASLALAPFPAAEAAPLPSVAMLGDSITAGYGLAPHEALPARLQDELARLGAPAQVIPSGVIGDTTAGGLARVDHAVPPEAEVCVVALGGNDFLHGLEPAAIRNNLERIVDRLKARSVKVVLAGVKVPAFLSSAYGAAFNDAFAGVAMAAGVIFLADLLDGVVLNPELNQEDGVHPNAAGVAVIARRLAPLVAHGLVAG